MIIEPEKIRVVDFLPRRAEANLQAEFYMQCRLRNIPVFLEYSSRWNESPGARFDAVIHQAGKILALCEIKKSPDPRRRMMTWRFGRQGQAYLSWDLPVFLLLSVNDFLEVWEWAQRIGLIQPAVIPAAAGGKPTEG